MSAQSLNTLVKKQPVVVAAAGASILLLAAFYFRHSEIPGLEVILDQRKAYGQRIESNISNGKQLAEQLESLTTANTHIASRLINPVDLAKNLQYFYKIEADTGAKLLDVHPLNQSPAVKAANKSMYPAVGYGLSVQGDYKKVISFLRRLEMGSNFCRIISATFGTATDTATLSLTLSVEILGQS